LNDGQIPNTRGVRVALGTPENPFTSRFATFPAVYSDALYGPQVLGMFSRASVEAPRLTPDAMWAAIERPPPTPSRNHSHTNGHLEPPGSATVAANASPGGWMQHNRSTSFLGRWKIRRAPGELGTMRNLGGAKSSVGDAKSSVGDAKSSLGDAKSSLGDAKSSLGDAKSSLGDAESSLGDAESSLGDAKSSLGDAKNSLGDAKSSLGDAKSSLGDAESSRWVTLRARWFQ
jgi:uncharacterized protein YjbJ (UPF0337 family)